MEENTNVQTDAEAGGETPELREAVMPDGDDTAPRAVQDITLEQTEQLADAIVESGDLDDVSAEPENSINPDAIPYAVGDKVKIAETFPAYRGAEGVITAIRQDPVGGNFYVADVELTTVKQAGTNEPVWFNNVALSQIEKVG
jgi:hypothetical protein